jgi:hypothetical protein
LFSEPAAKRGVALRAPILARSLLYSNPGNIEGKAMHAILGFFIVGGIGVGSLMLALQAISDGLQGL